MSSYILFNFLMLKVLHFTSNAAESRYFCGIADYTDRTTFNILFATLSPAGRLNEDMHARGILAFDLGCYRRRHYPTAIVKLASLLRRHSIDVIQTHLFEASIIGLCASRLAMTPLSILTRHHAEAVLLTGKRLPIVVDRICSRNLAHHIIAVSERTRETIVDYEGVPSRKIEVIPYGFDLGRLQPSENARQRIRGELSLDESTVFVTIGRLDPLKGHSVLFNAFAHIARSASDVKLLVVGEGPLRHSLQEMVQSMGIAERVHFLGFRRDIIDVIAASDVVVHPSFTEAFNQVISEACAVGKPIVATDVGGAREVIDPGVSGMIVRPGDERALLYGMQSILLRRREWAAMGAVGRGRVEQLTPQRMVKAYEEVYLRWMALRERR